MTLEDRPFTTVEESRKAIESMVHLKFLAVEEFRAHFDDLQRIGYTAEVKLTGVGIGGTIWRLNVSVHPITPEERALGKQVGP